MVIIQLTQKETSLLKDLCDSEKLCAEKYARASSQAHDPQLKNLFSALSQSENVHLESLCAVQNGDAPAPASGQSPSIPSEFKNAGRDCAGQDGYLLRDTLAAEKHASHLYDTCVFEFKDQKIRDLLNHIQKEEQNHGKALYDYMEANGMYQ